MGVSTFWLREDVVADSRELRFEDVPLVVARMDGFVVECVSRRDEKWLRRSHQSRDYT